MAIGLGASFVRGSFSILSCSLKEGLQHKGEAFIEVIRLASHSTVAGARPRLRLRVRAQYCPQRARRHRGTGADDANELREILGGTDRPAQRAVRARTLPDVEISCG